MTSDRFFYLKIVAIWYPVWVIMYFSTGFVALSLPPVNATLGIDSLVPFLPGFVWVYISCYMMPIFLVAIAKDWHRFNLVLFSLSIAHLVAFTIYLNLHIAVQKPDLNDSISEQILAVLYALEFRSWTNNLPSLHVTFAFTIAVGSLHQARGRAGEVLVFTWASCIAVSTLFVKQHIVLDVFAGLVNTAGSWALAQFLYSKLAVEHLNPPLALRQLTKKVGPWLLFWVVLMLCFTGIHWMFLRPHR